MHKTLITVEQLSKFMNCTPDSIYRKVKKGQIEHLNFGGMIRFDPDRIPGWKSSDDDNEKEKKD